MPALKIETNGIMAKLFIDSLKCIRKTDDPGNNDEVYLNLRTDGLEGRLPSSSTYWEMSNGDTQEIDHTYDFIRELTVTLMEDATGSDDTIGEFTFDVNIAPPGSPLIFNGEGASTSCASR